MSKEEAIKELKKMWLTVAIIGGIAGVAIVIDTGFSSPADILTNLFLFVVAVLYVGIGFGGIPIGWKWASTFITAVSIQGIVIKAVIALVLGWFALAYYTIKDIVVIVKANRG